MFGIGTTQTGALTRPVKRKWKMNPFQSVGVSMTAWVQADIGLRYHSIMLPYGGTTMTPAHMSSVRLKLNNETVWNLTGARIDTFDGLPAASTYGALVLNFERLGLIDHIKRYDTAINTGVPCRQAPNGINNMRIEVDIDSGAVAPTLGQPQGIVSPPNKDQGNFILRRTTYTENVPGSASAEFQFINKFNQKPNEPNLSRLYIEETAANLTNLRLNTNGTDDANISSALNNTDIAMSNIRKVNTGVVIWDSAADGNYNNYLRIGNAKTFNVYIIDSNANASLAVVAETLGNVTAA